MFRLTNQVQHYKWGKRDWLPFFLQQKNEKGEPWAELWMGAHPKSPSLTENGQKLNDLIQERGGEILGPEVMERYGRLPFLFKILAVEEPLSIQVHPSLSQAEEGFRRENDEGIPLDGFDRNYKDDNHKPEIICALEPYVALKGFRTMDDIKNNFTPLAEAVVWDISELNDQGSFFFSIMGLEDHKKELLLEAAAKLNDNSLEAAWVKKLMRFYPGDISALAPLYLNLVSLEPGEALFLPAGELHAYLSGVGMELMANSDNVLRGGLTPKHMDLEELRKIVNFTDTSVDILKKQDDDYYPSFADEFRLGHKCLSTTYELDIRGEAAILIVMGGDVVVSRENDQIHLKRGESLFIDHSHENPLLSGKGEVYWAVRK